jgi:hypothetical protein
MVQIFRKGSIDRLLVLLGLFALLHFPYLLWNDHILVQELLRIRLGERLANGWWLYAQAADDTAPLPALLYGLLAKIGLDDFRLLRILATFLILFQALWLNRMTIRYQLVSEKNYLIAFFYLLAARCGGDTLSLSPVLLGMTFILFSAGRFFRMLKEGASSEDAMFTGLWIGAAVICHPPCLVFLLPIFFSAVLFSGMRLNHYFLVAIACMLPATFFYAFFLYQGGMNDFMFCFFSGFRFRPLLILSNPALPFFISIFLLVICVLGWAVANQNSRVNFQRLGFNVFFFSSIAAFGGCFAGPVRSTESLLMLVPTVAFFSAQMVLLNRRRILNEVLGIFLLGIFGFGFYVQAAPDQMAARWNQALFIKEPPKGFTLNFRDKSLLLLSNDFHYYLNNPPATRFFRYYACDLNPDRLNTYQGLIYWYQCLAEDPPQLIYDPSGKMEKLALRIPEFGRCYRLSFYPNLYEAIPGKKFGNVK